MICVSLGSLKFDECTKALNKAEFAEIRMDLLDFTDEQFQTLFAIKHKTIATYRAGKISDAERLEKLKLAIASGAGYVDIEYESESVYRKDLVDFANMYNTQVIISYHNYQNTPIKEELDIIIEQSNSWGADIVKIATLANSEIDNARILGLYETNFNLLAFCMGEKGVITRLAAPLLGAPFTFAALNKEMATAPGQLTTEQLFDIYYSLGLQ